MASEIVTGSNLATLRSVWMKKRELGIEFIRVFAIFMVVAIHVSNIYINNFAKISGFAFNTAVVYNSFSRICVPLFFMVSGIFLIKQEFHLKSYCSRVLKFTALLAVWSVIYFLHNNDFRLDNLGKSAANSLLNANETSRHLWFMYAIIGIYIALPFIQNMCKNMSRTLENLFLILWFAFSGLIVIGVPLIRWITKTDVDITYPIPIINSAYYLGYFIIGHILYERFKDTIANRKKNLLCIGTYLASTLISILVTCLVTAQTNEVYDPMTWYRSIFIALAACAIFILIIINKQKFGSEIILTFSNRSFGIYLIHMLFLNYITDNINIIEFNPAFTIPLLTLIVYALSFISSFILSKIPLIKKLV